MAKTGRLRIQPFVFRSLRISAMDIAVEFETASARIYGQCRDVSLTGLRAAMEAQIAPQTAGRLTILGGRKLFEFHGHVACVLGAEVGIALQITSEWQQEQIEELVSIVRFGRSVVPVPYEPTRKCLVLPPSRSRNYSRLF